MNPENNRNKTSLKPEPPHPYSPQNTSVCCSEGKGGISGKTQTVSLSAAVIGSLNAFPTIPHCSEYRERTAAVQCLSSRSFKHKHTNSLTFEKKTESPFTRLWDPREQTKPSLSQNLTFISLISTLSNGVQIVFPQNRS